MARAALGQRVDRLQQHLDALRGDRLGDARELGIEQRRRGGLAAARASVRWTAGAPSPAPGLAPALCGASAVALRMVRAVVSSAATERPIMASGAFSGAGAASGCASPSRAGGPPLSSSASFLMRSWMSSTFTSG